MPTLTTTSSSNQAWTITSGLRAGDQLLVELWGAGSGGSGSSTSFRSGGGGGAYTRGVYTLTTADISAGTIAFFINTGSAGTGAANPVAGPDTWFKSSATLLAKGGAAHTGTAGGVGGAAASCIPSVGAFSGGSGATRAQGGGGGGSAGKDGAGASTTSGTGGTGDNGSGGAANTSNVEGGGGGTAAVTANAGGDPGGGGGAATTTNNGAGGGRGQIRLTQLTLPRLDGVAHNNNASASSLTATLTTTNTTDVIYVVALSNAGPITNVTSANLTFHQRVSQNAAGISIDAWYAIAANALTSEVITVTGTGTDFMTVSAFGIAGANTVNPFDPNPSLPFKAASGDATVSTSNANDLIIGAFRIAAGSDNTVVAPFASIDTSYDFLTTEYWLPGAIQNNLTISQGANTNNGVIADAVVSAIAIPFTPDLLNTPLRQRVEMIAY